MCRKPNIHRTTCTAGSTMKAAFQKIWVTLSQRNNKEKESLGYLTYRVYLWLKTLYMSNHPAPSVQLLTRRCSTSYN
jgi:hypothetical protein